MNKPVSICYIKKGALNRGFGCIFLKQLQEENSIRHEYEHKVTGFGTSNKTFYPLQARHDILDQFQNLVIEDLNKLHINISDKYKNKLTYMQ